MFVFLIVFVTIWVLISFSVHLDVSVRDIDVVEIVDGRADLPHNLGGLWKEKRRKNSLKPEANPASHNKKCVK